MRHLDYRDVDESGFDAISSIGLTEHVGRAQLPAYFRFLLQRVRPGGRLLNHCITRPNNLEPAVRKRHFINRFVFPDGELHGVGHIASVMHDTGFEVRHEENLREHYALTLAAWSANLDAHWDEAVAEVGLARARVWRLYLAGSRLGFERNTVQLHQVLGVRLDSAWRQRDATEARLVSDPTGDRPGSAKFHKRGRHEWQPDHTRRDRRWRVRRDRLRQAARR